MNVRIIATALFVLVACCNCAHTRVAVNNQQPPDAVVIPLINQLVSPVPAKYPSGETDLANVMEEINGYIHPKVERARLHLVEMGTDIYPILAEHIHDDRYSYSDVSAAWINISVGQMVVEIMAEGIQPHLGSYKFRKNPKGSNGPPSFAQMVKEFGGFEKYALHAKGRSKAELRNEYVQWLVAKERNYGFIDQAQQQNVIGAYLKLINEK
jgi:hypothetical protein